jgi:NADH-quinone oxidoreductase subunit J
MLSLPTDVLFEWLLAMVIAFSALGVILASKPVYSSLWFLLTLLTTAVLYLELSAPFIATMQMLVYAGAIMVIFMFIIVLFQDAHEQLARHKAKSSLLLLLIAMVGFAVAVLLLGHKLLSIPPANALPSTDFGSVESLGNRLYVDFVFPFEVLILPLLVAAVGTLYVAKKD